MMDSRGRIRGQKTEDRGQSFVWRCAPHSNNRRGKAAANPLSSVLCPLSSDACPLSSEPGFSLVEMMISITVGLMIIVALLGVLSSNARSSKSNDRTSELQTNGRYALDNLKRELRHAGYRGYTWADQLAPTATIGLNYPTGSVDECAGAGFVQNIGQGIWGANDNNPFDADCINNSYLRGDVLVIRRVANRPTPDVSLSASTIYQRSTYTAAVAFKGTSLPGAIVGTPVATFAIQVYVYYIGSDDADGTVPALRRIALQADGSMIDEMVVRGIEHLQVQYGISIDQSEQYWNANSIVGTPLTTALTGWNDVNSVRIWLLARNSRAETGYINSDS